MGLEPQRETPGFRVVCWNMGAAYGPYVQRHDCAWHWLAALDPDLMLLQETVPPAWARELWNVHTLPYTHWASAIAVRPGIPFAPIEPAPESLLGRFESYLATGDLTLGDGSTMLIGSVHARAAEAPAWVTEGHDTATMARPSVGVPWSNDVAFAAYRELAAGRRFLIGGDWNTARYLDDAGVAEPMGQEFFERTSAAGWIELSLDAEGHEGRSWYGSGNPRPYQNDHVFSDPATAEKLKSFLIDPYPVTSLSLSDHAPLLVELVLA